MTGQRTVEIRKQSLRGAIDNFRRLLNHHEKEAAGARAEIKRLKEELLDTIEDEEAIVCFLDEVKNLPK